MESLDHEKWRRLYRNLSIEWPCAFGDWLYASLVIAPAKFLNELTPRRVTVLVVAVLLVVAIAQSAPFLIGDAFSIASDSVLYIDAASAMLLAAVLAQARYVIRGVSTLARWSLRRAHALAILLRRTSARRNRARRTRLLAARKDTDDERHALTWAYA